MGQEPRICDYEGSSYRTDFWEGQGREYEDLAERSALRRLLPLPGRRLLDIGAGFGRLSEFYDGFEQVVLLDYSRSLLRQAQTRLGQSHHTIYVASSFYSMPFADSTFDTAMMVRVMHHVEDVPALLKQVARTLSDRGTYVLEFASKRHLKAIYRFVTGRQPWSPFDRTPYEFAEMNFDFHPAWMQERLTEAGFHVKQRLTVSHFRLPLLKRLIPARALATADRFCQFTGRWWQLTPSIFVQCTRTAAFPAPAAESLFRCPTCHNTSLQPSPEALICERCRTHWPIQDGIYDFTSAPPPQSYHSP